MKTNLQYSYKSSGFYLSFFAVAISLVASFIFLQVYQAPKELLFSLMFVNALVIIVSFIFLFKHERSTQENSQMLTKEFEKTLKQQQEQNDALQDANFGILISNELGQISFQNKELVRIFLGNSYGAIGDFAKCIHPEDRSEFARKIDRCYQDKVSYSTQLRLLKSTGEIEKISIEGTPQFEMNGIYSGHIHLVSELKFDIEKLQFDSLIRQAIDKTAIIALTDHKGNIVHANDAFCEISGYSREELIGQNHRLLKSGEHLPAFYRDLWKTISYGLIWKGEVCNKRKDGSIYWVATNIVPLLGSQGRPTQYLSLRVDISERKWQESIFECMNDIQRAFILNTTDLKSLYSYILDRLNRLTRSEFGFVGKVERDSEGHPYLNTFSISHPSWAQSGQDANLNLTNLNSLFGFTIQSGQRLIDNNPEKEKIPSGLPEGLPKVESYVGIPISVDGKLYGMIGLINRPSGYSEEMINSLGAVFDLIGQMFGNLEQKKKTETLNRMIETDKVELESLLNSINEMVFFLDENLLFSKAWTSNKYNHYFPTNSFIGLTVGEGLGPVLAEQLLPSIIKCKESTLPQFKEICIEESSQTWWNFKFKRILVQKKIVIMINVYDITVERKMREELDQQKIKAEASARLAGLGEMAAGIAHEINNPLAIVAGYAQSLIKQIKSNNLDPEKVILVLNKINNATERASGIVKSMQKLTRQQQLDPSVGFPVSEIYQEAYSMLQPKLKISNANIEFISDIDNLEILGRSGEVLQIFINLISNGLDAISNLEDRWIRVQTNATEDFVYIKFVDSGNGIPIDIANKIMQPFFTTKAPNRGTGLGLSISSTLAKNNEGELSLDHTARNTTFILKLKRAKLNIDSQAA